MADVKISELPALTTPSGGEELVVNASGTTKKITQANLLKGGVTTDKLTLTHAGSDLFATIEGPNARSLRFDLKDNGTSDIFEFRNAAEDSLLKIDRTGHLTPLGGVYLGGTGSANLLQDYESGTFTPVIRDSTSASGGNAATATYSYGQFTKIGNLVTITIMFQNINRQSTTASSNIQIHGLPFASQAVSGSVFQQGTVGGSFLSFEADGAYLTSEAQDGTTYMRIAENRSGAGRDFLTFSQLASDSTSDMYISIHYKTTA